MTLTTKRAVAFIIDAFVYAIVLFVAEMIVLTITNNSVKIAELCMLFVSIFYIAKDVFGRSIGKKIMNIYIRIDKPNFSNQGKLSNDENKVTWQKLLLRNITILIWPIEALMVLTGSRRIGEMITHTHVEDC